MSPHFQSYVVYKKETMYAFSIVEILSGNFDIRLITLNKHLDASIDGSSVFFHLPFRTNINVASFASYTSFRIDQGILLFVQTRRPVKWAPIHHAIYFTPSVY